MPVLGWCINIAALGAEVEILGGISGIVKKSREGSRRRGVVEKAQPCWDCASTSPKVGEGLESHCLLCEGQLC